MVRRGRHGPIWVHLFAGASAGIVQRFVIHSYRPTLRINDSPIIRKHAQSVACRVSLSLSSHHRPPEFDLDTIKMLMNMFDVDRSGTITFNGTLVRFTAPFVFLTTLSRVRWTLEVRR
jgi:hypothetical protein